MSHGTSRLKTIRERFGLINPNFGRIKIIIGRAIAADIDGTPPAQLIERGLMLELEEGMWLHEALRSRLLRDVGKPFEERLRKLNNAAD